MISLSEKQMVQKATPRILDALRLDQKQCRMAHELTVGHSIADIVILKTNFEKTLLPNRPLSVIESSILCLLRHSGAAGVESIATGLSMHSEVVSRLLRGRLSSYLVQTKNDKFKTSKAWISQSEIIAIEAKLMRWRDAIAQASAYRRYADRAYVLLPNQIAAIASQHKHAFTEAGVGLLSYEDGYVVRVFSSSKAKDHNWHREFAISRIW